MKLIEGECLCCIITWAVSVFCALAGESCLLLCWASSDSFMVQGLEQNHPVGDFHVPIMNALYFDICAGDMYGCPSFILLVWPGYLLSAPSGGFLRSLMVFKNHIVCLTACLMWLLYLLLCARDENILAAETVLLDMYACMLMLCVPSISCFHSLPHSCSSCALRWMVLKIGTCFMNLGLISS